MKDTFFQKILNVAEDQPFMTTVTRDERASRTIAQISEGEHGELTVALQEPVGPLYESDDTQATITLPQHLYGEPFGMDIDHPGTIASHGERTVPLYPDRARTFLHLDDGTKRIINGESISLVKPVRATTLTLWYENISTEVWTTNVDKEAVTISHGDSSITEIPPHGVTEFFIAVKKPEIGQPPIEWDIGDTHQGVIIRTDRENPFVRIAIEPASDRDITWHRYIARMWVEREDSEIRDLGFHVSRTDETEMGLTEIKQLERVFSHSLSFMHSTWCRPKVAIAWKEAWSDSQWWETWSPVWAAWKPNSPTEKNRTKNWLPMSVGPEEVLRQVLRNIREDHYPIVERYVHNERAIDYGDWASSITASVAILQRLAVNSGFRIERRGLELWQGIAGYLRSKAVERPYYYVGWGEEAERLIEDGEPHDHLVKAITELRNQVTAHWEQDGVPTNASWLAQQAMYYVEAAMRAELAPSVPMWDRTRAFHHPPITGG